MTPESLQRIIDEHTRGSGSGSVSVVVHSAGGLEMHHRADAIHRSASLIKVPIMMMILDAVRNGTLTMDQLVPAPEPAGGSGVLQNLQQRDFSVGDLLTLMIVVSDNMATNALIDLIGIPAVNAWLRRAGLADTVLARRMMDTAAAESGHENVTTARDMASILDAVSTGRLPGSDDAVRILLGQQSEVGLPEYLPDGWLLAHKTGGLDGLRHDAGIVTTDSGQSATVVVMCDGFRGTDGPARAFAIARAVGRGVCEYFVEANATGGIN